MSRPSTEVAFDRPSRTPAVFRGAGRLGLLAVVLWIGGASQPSARVAGDPGKGDGERIHHLLGAEVRDIRSLPGLTASPKALLISRAGIATTVLDTLRRYAANLPDQLGDTQIALLTIDFRGKPVRLGAALDPKGALLGLHAYDDFGDVIEEVEPFLSAFRGAGGVRLTDTSAKPIGEVIEARDAILGTPEPPKDKEGRAAWVLLRHHQLMWKLGSGFETLLAAREAGGAMRQELTTLRETIAEVSEFTTHLRQVMKVKSMMKYRELLAELDARAEDALRAVDAEDREAAAKIASGNMKLACSRCHGYDGNEWRKPFESELRRQRVDAGFGVGSFVVGVDVRPTGLDEDDAQAFASAVKAVLLVARG